MARSKGTAPAVAFALAAVACVPAAELELELRPETRSVILLGVAGGQRHGLALDAASFGSGPVPIFQSMSEDGEPTVLLELEHTLAELSLAQGDVSPLPVVTDRIECATRDHARSLSAAPYFPQPLRSQLAIEGRIAPVDRGQLPAWVLEPVFPPFSRVRCLERGGCYDRLSGGGEICKLDCPAVAPAAPEPPQTPGCPTGVTAQPESCEQPRFAERARCAMEKTAHFAGEPVCSPLGEPCSSTFPSTPGATHVLYVAQGGTGDGATQDAPLGSISGAVALARAGTVIALGPGTISAPGALDKDVTIVGACAESTEIVGPLTTAVGLALRDLTVRAPSGTAIQSSGGVLALENVAVLGSGDTGISVSGRARLAAASLLVRGFATSIAAVESDVRLSRASLEGHTAHAIRSTGPSLLPCDGDNRVGAAGSVTVQGLAVTTGAPRAAARWKAGGALCVPGAAICVCESSSVTLTRLVLEARSGLSLVRSNARVADVVVRSSSIAADVFEDEAAFYLPRSEAAIARVMVDRAPRDAVGVALGGHVAIEDLRSRDTGGRGIAVGYDNASVAIARAKIERSVWSGIHAHNFARVTGSDLIVSGVVVALRGTPDDEGGPREQGEGIRVSRSHAEIARARISDTELGCVRMASELSSGKLADLHIERCGSAGLNLEPVGEVDIERVRIEGAVGGLEVSKGDRVSVTDLAQRGGQFGVRFAPGSSSITLVLERFALEDTGRALQLLTGPMSPGAEAFLKNGTVTGASTPLIVQPCALAPHPEDEENLALPLVSFGPPRLIDVASALRSADAK